jgi:hypothetical protein
MAMVWRGKAPHLTPLSLTFAAKIDYTPPSAFTDSGPGAFKLARLLGCCRSRLYVDAVMIVWSSML